MAYWLADRLDGQETDWIQRFDPRFWTVNFPRPMMASVITTAPDALRVDASFLRKGDLAGLIWESADTLDHPLLAYHLNRDYARTTLSFRWRSAGVLPLDAVNGPTLTIEGRDAAGQPRAWYVRLWNYADGDPDDAQITLPFSQLDGGFMLPDEADPVYPSDIDRLFISLVAPGYEGGSADPLSSPVDGWAELSQIKCEGHRAMLRIGDVMVPPHGLAAATAFDDNGTQTPERLVRTMRSLGYRGSVVHYVGMSHFMRLVPAGGGYVVPGSGAPLCPPAVAWHLAFFQACKAAGYSPICSLSYELLAQHCPDDWQQRAFDGTPARTGWSPPSALLSPASGPAMAWLQAAAGMFVGLMRQAGTAVRFQVGEPWWWTMADGRPCLYDASAKAALGGAPAEIANMRAPLNPAQKSVLDAAGTLLSASTAALVAAVRAAAAPEPAETLLLAFLPTVLDPAMPEAKRANLPIGWASPAFDRLQIEDYDWLTAGRTALRTAAYAEVNQRLNYPPAEQDYFAGFVLNAQDKALWRLIDQGIDQARARQHHEVFVWAVPQICRDGFVRLPEHQDINAMQAFDDVLYPIPLGRDTMISPEFSTAVTITASGFERRNSLWSDARMRYDVGPGVRSEQELGVLLEFFRARRGAARGFRLSDPADFSSRELVAPPTMLDQLLGLGDGITTQFPLIKHYGSGEAQQRRRITRPRPGSVMVSVGGAAMITGWTLGAGGVIAFLQPPAAESEVRAGFLFDVPVRFAEDRLELSGASFAAGEAPSVPVIEVREAP